MATSKKPRSEPNGRGSPEAVAKRRAARELNAMLSDGTCLDGRAKRRRNRLLQELKKGRAGVPLKPIEFVSHVDELLGLGETVASLRKQGVQPRTVPASADIAAVVRRAQRAYSFAPDAWKLLGVNLSQSGASLGGRGRTRRQESTS